MADDTSLSSRAFREFRNALTAGNIFGVPRFTTALLPSVTGNQGGLVWDTTTNTLKGCNGATWAAIAGGTGDVVGPASSTDNAAARFDGTTGKLLQNSLLTIDDLGNLTVPAGTVSVPAINFSGGGNQVGLYVGGGASLNISDTANGTLAMQLWSTKITMRRDTPILWSTSSSDIASSFDTGLSRYSAGVLQLTDGSTGIRGLFGGGASVASDTALPLPTGSVFHVTGTNNITSIISTNFQSGVMIVLIFDGALTFTDGNNLKLNGNFVTTADDTITLMYDGTNWYEMFRSVN